MDDPTYLREDELFASPIEFIRDIRNWKAEQREKYGDHWEDIVDLAEYNRSRNLGPYIGKTWK